MPWKETNKMEQKEAFINEDIYPVRMVDYMEENLDMEKVKLYNEYDFGFSFLNFAYCVGYLLTMLLYKILFGIVLSFLALIVILETLFFGTSRVFIDAILKI